MVPASGFESVVFISFADCGYTRSSLIFLLITSLQNQLITSSHSGFVFCRVILSFVCVSGLSQLLSVIEVSCELHCFCEVGFKLFYRFV